MSEQQIDRAVGFTAYRNQPLIGVILQESGQEVVRYFAEEADADAAISSSAIQGVLNLAGVWSDLSWEEVEKDLYRIRHESNPTPPLSL
jgi:hypothetical protein